MSETSRRGFLGVAGAGAAAAGAVALTPGVAHAASARLHPNSAKVPVVAYIEDVTASTLVLMVGEHEVTVHDRDLVTRLLNAAGR